MYTFTQCNVLQHVGFFFFAARAALKCLKNRIQWCFKFLFCKILQFKRFTAQLIIKSFASKVTVKKFC